MPTHKTLSISAATNHSRHTGFSLLEVIIAIGILGVGLVLIATIFPVGLKMTDQSNRATVGSIIAENGIAIAKTIFTAQVGLSTDPQKPTAVATDIFDINATCIDELTVNNAAATTWGQVLYDKLQAGDDMRNYRNDKKYGFAVLARKTATGTNRYQIICTSYKKRKKNDTKVRWMEVQLPKDGTTSKAHIIPKGVFSIVVVDSSGTSPYLVDNISAWIGSPLIFSETGDWGIIKAVDTKYKVGATDKRVLILDRLIPDQLSDDVTGKVEAYVLIEADWSDMDPIANKSPALYTMTTMTGLRK